MCARMRPPRRRGSGHRVPRRQRRCRRGRTRLRREPVVRCRSRATPSISLSNASGRWSRPEKQARLRARRSPRVAMTVDVNVCDSDGRRSHACSRCRRLDRAGSRHSRPDGDRRWSMSSASISAIAAQSRAAKFARKRSATWLAAFSSRRACGCNSSKRASAASRSASSKISQRLIRSPSTVRTVDHLATRRRSRLARSHDAASVTTAPRSVSR